MAIQNTKIVAILIVAVIAVYFPALQNGILQWDDNLYVTDNDSIKSLHNIPEFFKSFYVGNYQPLTILVYSVIFHFAGTSPLLYHLINVLFHLLNSLLVFYFIKALLRNTSLAWITALLFALHPLRVESVAWISELKDVMYAFFFLLSLIYYLHFIRENKPGLLLIAFFFYLLSLMSKGQAVALFPTLFLVDYLENEKIRNHLKVKIPFFILSVIFGIIAVMAQKSSNSIGNYKVIPFLPQTALACYGFSMYILKTLIPFDLSSFYPYPVMVNGSIPSGYWAAIAVIPLTLVLLFRLYKKDKILFTGLLFFIINIALLLQLIPVGNCIMADRYTYISSIGLSLMIARLFLKDENRKNKKMLYRSTLGLYLLFLSLKTYSQTKNWKNDFTLWDNTLSVNPDIESALVLRGCAYNDRGAYNKALVDFDKAIRIDDKDGLAWFNRGISKSKTGDFKNAAGDFERADKLKLEKRYLVNFYVSWGGALANTGKLHEAMDKFDKAIRLNPSDASIYNNRGITRAMLGDMNGALNDFIRAVDLNPSYSEAVNNRNKVLASLHKIKD